MMKHRIIFAGLLALVVGFGAGAVFARAATRTFNEPAARYTEDARSSIEFLDVRGVAISSSSATTAPNLLYRQSGNLNLGVNLLPGSTFAVRQAGGEALLTIYADGNVGFPDFGLANELASVSSPMADIALSGENKVVDFGNLLLAQVGPGGGNTGPLPYCPPSGGREVVPTCYCPDGTVVHDASGPCPPYSPPSPTRACLEVGDPGGVCHCGNAAQPYYYDKNVVNWRICYPFIPVSGDVPNAYKLSVSGSVYAPSLALPTPPATDFAYLEGPLQSDAVCPSGDDGGVLDCRIVSGDLAADGGYFYGDLLVNDYVGVGGLDVSGTLFVNSLFVRDGIRITDEDTMVFTGGTFEGNVWGEETSEFLAADLFNDRELLDEYCLAGENDSDPLRSILFSCNDNRTDVYIKWLCPEGQFVTGITFLDPGGSVSAGWDNNTTAIRCAGL